MHTWQYALSVLFAIYAFLFGFLIGLGILPYYGKSIASTDSNFNDVRVYWRELQTMKILFSMYTVNSEDCLICRVSKPVYE